MNQEVLIGQCLNGEREPDCDYCPAHSTRGGSCCFGVRHEYGDPDCQACVLEGNCAFLTHGVAKSDDRPAPRIIYPSRAPAKAPVRTAVPPGAPIKQAAPAVRQYGAQLGEPLLIQQPITPEPIQLNPSDGLFKKFLKVGAWGAGEGFFEMGLNFFRKRRPE